MLSVFAGRRFSPQFLFYLSAWLFLWTQFCELKAAAHATAWSNGMYCRNGTKPGVDNKNGADATLPLYKLKKKDWWMHHSNRCDEFPPAEGDFLELPANGEFTVEIAVNRAFTSLSYNGRKAGLYPDGRPHPGLGTTSDGRVKNSNCIGTPNIHAQNESMAAGTSFAISYTSDITKVTEDNLVVFTVLAHTPWRRLATYKVPNLPACPEGGCICTWGWVPNNCGQPNMYMLPYRCKVTGNTGNLPLARPVPPVWCEDDPSKCVQGAKQPVFFNQLEGNNVVVTGFDLAGEHKAPSYNHKMGFTAGPQTDIFNTSATPVPTSSISQAPSSTLFTTATPTTLSTTRTSASSTRLTRLIKCHTTTTTVTVSSLPTETYASQAKVTSPSIVPRSEATSSYSNTNTSVASNAFRAVPVGTLSLVFGILIIASLL